MGDLIDLDLDEARAARRADRGRAVEATIEDTIVAQAEAAGWFVRKLQYPGRRNAPDRMFIKDGRVVFVEFKRAKKHATTAQATEGRRILDHGGEWHSVNSLALARRILGLDG